MPENLGYLSRCLLSIVKVEIAEGLSDDSNTADGIFGPTTMRPYGKHANVMSSSRHGLGLVLHSELRSAFYIRCIEAREIEYP